VLVNARGWQRAYHWPARGIGVLVVVVVLVCSFLASRASVKAREKKTGQGLFFVSYAQPQSPQTFFYFGLCPVRI
jgi:hypothetical protein